MQQKLLLLFYGIHLYFLRDLKHQFKTLISILQEARVVMESTLEEGQVTGALHAVLCT